MAEMTTRQKRFCDEYLICLNATQAAIKAGYSEKYAGQNADKLLKNTNVKEYLQKRMADKQEELIADQDEVLRYLTSVMRRELKESVVVTIQEKIEEWVKAEDTETLKKQTITTEKPCIVEIPARLSDSNKAAELLGKAYGIYTERIDADVDMELNINIDYGDGANAD